MDEEMSTEGQSKDEQEQVAGNSNPSEEGGMTFTGIWNTNVMPVIKALEGPQSGNSKEARNYRIALKNALKEADDNSEFAKAFNEMLEAKQDQRQDLMNKINELFKKQDKC
jgi:hypothetical protein